MQLEKVAGVVVLRMQAGKANAIGPAWLARMETLLDEALAARPRALVITGYQGFFSAGLDLPSLDTL
jgi:Delta3-Delta2-enoyl-CoA isomerase